MSTTVDTKIPNVGEPALPIYTSRYRSSPFGQDPELKKMIAPFKYGHVGGAIAEIFS